MIKFIKKILLFYYNKDKRIFKGSEKNETKDI